MLTLVVCAQAGASDYPKVLRKDGQVCVQTLNNKGVVEESCRAEGSDARFPVQASSGSDRPVADARPVPTPQRALAPPTPGALYWADAKKNWGLAFKIGAVGALSAALIASVGALVAAGTSVPHAADSYLATAGIAGTGAVLFGLIAALMDRWGFHEIEPEPEE